MTSAPSVADVVGAPPGAFLDLPGDALRPRCRYARDFASLRDAGRAPPLTYAHIAREAGRPGLVVQYFFFYYFNQFNDLHEGDWEGMQIAFDDAETPAEALEQGPTRMVLFQHRGGEQADWDDPKVEKRGTHPVVYPAAGSHATFYGPGVYVGHGSDGSAWAATTPRRHCTPSARSRSSSPTIRSPATRWPGCCSTVTGASCTAGSAATDRPARC